MVIIINKIALPWSKGRQNNTTVIRGQKMLSNKIKCKVKIESSSTGFFLETSRMSVDTSSVDTIDFRLSSRLKYPLNVLHLTSGRARSSFHRVASTRMSDNKYVLSQCPGITLLFYWGKGSAWVEVFLKSINCGLKAYSSATKRRAGHGVPRTINMFDTTCLVARVAWDPNALQHLLIPHAHMPQSRDNGKESSRTHARVYAFLCWNKRSYTMYWPNYIMDGVI